MSKRSALMLGAAVLSGGIAVAQESEDRETRVQAEEIVVQGEIAYRDLSDSIAPTLEYDTEFFQRFEPLTAGDALKRVPSVAFVGTDILESDQAQLRGLGGGYTQILINGEQVPGSGDDRTFFLDRIPAELIERVEIIRSSSASRSGDAVAGALNIVLRDGYSLDGGYVRAGAILFPDNRVGKVLGAVYGGEAGPGRFIIGANVQDRRNPKLKSSTRLEPDDGVFAFENREDQTDTRDGTDYSVNANYTLEILGGELDLTGVYVFTDRYQDEDSIEYADPASLDFQDILTLNTNDEDVDQRNYSVVGEFERDAFGGEFEIQLGYAAFKDDLAEFEFEADLEPFTIDGEDLAETEFEGEYLLTDRTDEEFTAEISQEWELSDAVEVEIGVDYRLKTRDTELLLSEMEGTPGFLSLPIERGDFPAFGEEFEGTFGGYEVEVSAFEPEVGGISRIEETRIDPYVQFNGEYDTLAWELGLRYETTETDVTVDPSAAPDNEDDAVLAQSSDYAELLPSGHLQYRVTPSDRVSLSVARTLRRPKFSDLSPAFLEGEFGDNDFIGNPQLDPETAWGFDLGYERALGETGVFGVNVFYRDIADLIELYNTLNPSVDAVESFEDDVDDAADDGLSPGDEGYPVFDPDSFVYSVRNGESATVWGIEFDLSTPLTFAGLPNTGFFANYSFLDSEVRDEIGKRRINDQAEYVFNTGFIHNLPAYDAAFGVTYRDQGDAVNRVVAEEVLIQYGPNLEAFVEKSFGERFTLRLAGQNLLDESKDERFYKFDNLGDQLSGDIDDFDELEYESEEAGPVFTLIGRYAF